jgi:23S rRNA (uridine2552-2'-O)-methyltransferase
MSKSSGSSRWLQRQKRDPYVKQVRHSHYRSRAVYKLMEIDEKDKLLHKGQTVIDLGAAPGSWSQYVADKVSTTGKVIAVDILHMDPIDNVQFIEGDFTEQETFEKCLQGIEKQEADLVISDMAPNLSGIKVTDQARSLYLAELATDLACQVLRPGGDLLVKVFQGSGTDRFRLELQEHFARILTRKPGASRAGSREFYLLARTFRC